MSGKATRIGLLAGVVGWLAGCPAAPQAPRETVVRNPVASPRSLAPAPAESREVVKPFGGQSPVPFSNDLLPSAAVTVDPAATGPAAGHITLGPDAKPASQPDPEASPTFTYAGKGLYAGPFQMGPGGTIVHVEHEPDGAPGTFLLHLDSDDQREKNLVLEATGKLKTTFKFPGRAGPYAFYLQMDPPGPWSVDVYALPASPSPKPSPTADTAASGAATPTPKP
jgi:hypothetical protein